MTLFVLLYVYRTLENVFYFALLCGRTKKHEPLSRPILQRRSSLYSTIQALCDALRVFVTSLCYYLKDGVSSLVFCLALVFY